MKRLSRNSNFATNRASLLLRMRPAVNDRIIVGCRVSSVAAATCAMPIRSAHSSDGPAPAMPPGYVPIDQRSVNDESLKFVSKASSSASGATAAVAATKAPSSSSSSATVSSSSQSAIATDGIYRPNAHLVEGYVREDGKVLTRRGDGQGAILEFVDPLPPTKLGQLKHDLVNRDLPSTPKAMREAAVKSYIAKDEITRVFGVQSREDFVDKVDEAQRRKDGGVPEEQLPIFDEFGHKTLRRETGRGYRSVDGGKILLPKDRVAIEGGGGGAADEAEESRAGGRADDSASSSAAAASSTSSPSSSLSPSRPQHDEEHDAIIEALRNRRKSRSNKLFNNINTIDDEEATQTRKPTVVPPTGGVNTFIRHEGTGDESPIDDLHRRKFDPLQQMLKEREREAAERREAARQRSVWSDEMMGKKADGFRGDVLGQHINSDYDKKKGASSSYAEKAANSASGREAAEGDDTALPHRHPRSHHASHSFEEEEGEANGAGEEQMTAEARARLLKKNSKKSFDIAAYRREMEELDYYIGTPSYAEKKAAFDKKYGMFDEEGQDVSDQFRAPYTSKQVEQGLENEPIDIAHGSLKFQQAVAGNQMLKFHPGIVAGQMGLNTFKGYAFPPSVELGKLQRDVAIEAERQMAMEKKVKQKDFLEKVTGFDPIQRKQVKLVLADFDRKDTQTAMHVLHSYPYADNIAVFLVCALFMTLYQLQIIFDADEFYQEFLGIDNRTRPQLRKPMYGIIAFFVAACFVHPCNLGAISLTRAYRIYMRRPLGPP